MKGKATLPHIRAVDELLGSVLLIEYSKGGFKTSFLFPLLYFDFFAHGSGLIAHRSSPTPHLCA